MPTTLSSLVLFLVLLLPGYAYLVGKERHTVGPKHSTFRETVSIVAASVTAEISVLASAPFQPWLIFLDLPALVAEPRDHAVGITLALTVMLLAATVTAYVATWPATRDAASTLRTRFLGSSVASPHESSVSAWWLMFNEQPDKLKWVDCMLDDGSYVGGLLGSFTKSSDDSPDRDLRLIPGTDGNLAYSWAGEAEVRRMKASAICVSARRLTAVVVSHVDRSAAVSPSQGE